MSEPQLLTIDRAAIVAGMHQRTLRRRIAAGELVTLKDPRDRRKKLIRLADLQKYLGDLPMQHAA